MKFPVGLFHLKFYGLGRKEYFIFGQLSGVVDEHWLHNAKTGERKECVGSGSNLERLSYPSTDFITEYSIIVIDS